MIQDIQPYKFHNEYTNALPDADSFLMVVRERTVLAKIEDGQITLPRWKAFPAETCTYLFSVDEEKFFLLEEDAASEKFLAECEKDGYAFCEAGALRSRRPEWKRFAAVTAIQLGSWYQSNRFCGKCGSHMEKDTKERMLCCSKCGSMVYPKICPAVIVGVIYQDRLLVTKYAGREFRKYALVAGFTEIGETAEETVRREVLEETGLHVTNVRYYKSQPWALSDTLLLGYFCEVEGEPEISLDDHELSEARWMEREELPAETDGVSLTNEMMVYFRRYGREGLYASR